MLAIAFSFPLIWFYYHASSVYCVNFQISIIHAVSGDRIPHKTLVCTAIGLKQSGKITKCYEQICIEKRVCYKVSESF